MAKNRIIGLVQQSGGSRGKLRENRYFNAVTDKPEIGSVIMNSGHLAILIDL